MSETASEATLSGNDPSARKRRRLRPWHFCVAAALVFIVAVLGLRYHWRRGFHQRIEALAAAGYPVTPEELDAWYEWPQSGDNAADWILDAGPRLVKPSDKDYRRLRELADRPEKYANHEPLPQDLMDLSARHVEANAEALRLLHEAAAITESRYPIDLSNGVGTLMPHASVYADACCLLSLKALLCIENDDPDGAVRAIEDAFGIAHSLDREPIIISQRIRTRSQRITLEVLQRLLCRQILTASQLTRLETVLREAYDPNAIVRSLVGERCIYVEIIANPELVDPEFLPRPTPLLILEAYKALGLAAREGIAFLDTMEAFIQDVQLPASHREEVYKTAITRQRTCTRRSLLWPRDVDWIMVLHDIWCLIGVRMATAALAVDRFRVGTGDWPETLPELIPDYLPAVPEDPVDGAPIRYRRLDHGFVVYSVGWDRTDDGGRVQQEGKYGEPFDITFTVERQGAKHE